MLVDSGSAFALLSLDVALALGMQPWQLGSGHVRQIDQVLTSVCQAPSGLTVGIWGFAARELPAVVLKHRSRIPRQFDVLGRLALFGPLTLLFEDSPSGPRVVFCDAEVEVVPGRRGVLRKEGSSSGDGPYSRQECDASGEGWVSFPYLSERPGGLGNPIVPVRLCAKKGTWVEVPMVVDTGATFTVLPSTIAQELGLPLWRMPGQSMQRADGNVHAAALGRGVKLQARIGELPPVTLPFIVSNDAGRKGRVGNLACAGLLDQLRLVFHREEGTDRVTFLDAERFPPT